MLMLDDTTKSLEVVLDAAPATTQPTWTAHWVDLTSAIAVSAASETDGASNGTTAVTMVAAPASGHTRQVKEVTVYNGDTAAVTVTVQINNNSTIRIVAKVTLQAGEMLEID